MGNYLGLDSKGACPTSKSCPSHCPNGYCWNNQNCQLFDTRQVRVSGEYSFVFIIFCEKKNFRFILILLIKAVMIFAYSGNISLLAFIWKYICSSVRIEFRCFFFSLRYYTVFAEVKEISICVRVPVVGSLIYRRFL